MQAIAEVFRLRQRWEREDKMRVDDAWQPAAIFGGTRPENEARPTLKGVRMSRSSRAEWDRA
jgi:hypothetical protein